MSDEVHTILTDCVMYDVSLRVNTAMSLTFSDIPRDVVSELGQYMSTYELMRRSSIDPRWDDELTQRSEVDILDDLRRAIQEGDIDLVGDILDAVDDPMRYDLLIASLNESGTLGNTELTSYLLERWIRSQPEDVPEIVLDIALTSGRYDLLRAIMNVLDYGLLTEYINDYGEMKMRALLSLAIDYGIVGLDSLIEYMKRSVDDVTSVRYLANVLFFYSFLQKYDQGYGLYQSIRRLQYQYILEGSRVVDRHRDRIMSSIYDIIRSL